VGRILIVEDVAELAEELMRAAPHGHELVRAASTAEAIARLNDERVDLVVTALVLERDFEDGLKIAKAAAARVTPCPAIIVTSYGTPQTCGAAIRERAFDYIERNSPGIDFGELLRWKMSLALAPSAYSQVASPPG
jgi:DNA-binding NtrC family response regulator